MKEQLSEVHERSLYCASKTFLSSISQQYTLRVPLPKAVLTDFSCVQEILPIKSLSPAVVYGPLIMLPIGDGIETQSPILKRSGNGAFASLVLTIKAGAETCFPELAREEPLPVGENSILGDGAGEHSPIPGGMGLCIAAAQLRKVEWTAGIVGTQ